MKPLYKSQINDTELMIRVYFCSAIAFLLFWGACEASIAFTIFADLLLCYLCVVNAVSIYSFYEDRIEILYPLRKRNRRITIAYSDITEIKYRNIGGYTLYPSIALVYKDKALEQFPKGLSLFYQNRYQKRKDILLHLHSKGLPIIINSLFNKDKEIIEATQANGSWNYYTVIDGKVKSY